MTKHLLPLVLVATSVLAACDPHETSESIELGAPRQLLYVADDTSAAKHGGAAASAIHVFELDSLAHVGEFDGGDGVGEIHATPDGALLWIVATDEGTVSLFDTSTYELVELAVGVRPVHSYISADHAEIWVGNDGSADVSVISVAQRNVAATVLTGSGHHKMAVVEAPAGSGMAGGVYVSNITDGTITPVGADHVASTNVPGVGPAPHGMDASFVTGRVYNCSGDAAHSVEVIATQDEPGTVEDDRNSIVARIPLPARCGYLHVSDDGEFAFATIASTNQLARIRLDDHHVDLFATDAAPDKFEIVGETAFVVHTTTPTVSVIDLTGATATTSIAVGRAIAPGATSGHRSVRYHQNRLYVPNAYDGTVSVIDTTTRTVVATLGGMHAPIHVAIAGPGFGTTYPR